MKKHFILYFIIFFSALSCKKESNSETVNNSKLPEVHKLPPPLDYSKYVLNPRKTDSLCLYDIERAKNDLKKYPGVYVQTICFGCDFKPYEEEIKEVLKKRKFKLGVQDIGCLRYEGQTPGCYRAYIDLKMKEKYGENYKSEIETEAQNILIKNISINDKIISIYDVEDNERPKVFIQNAFIDGGTDTTIKTDLPINKKSSHNLFVDVNFIIEKNGTISNLTTDNWVNENGVNEKYKDDLINLAIKILKKNYNNWKPGTYKGNKARVENNLRVSFE
jgi:hypothetical protein